MARILVVDNSLFEGPIFRLLLEGHEVIHYNEWKQSLDPKSLAYGKGILTAFSNYKMVDDFISYLDWSDVIVFTDCNNGATADRLREKGYNVWGASSLGTALETERGLYKKYGLFENSPKEEKAKSYEEARKILKSGEFKRPVLKADLITSSALKTYVSRSIDDALVHLERLNEAGAFEGEKGGVLICEYIEGVEIAIDVIVGKNGFVTPFVISHENKRMFPGDLGPLTGEMGTVVYNLDPEKDSLKLAEVLTKHEDWYTQNYGTGCLDINMIVSYEDGKPYILEYTSRFGYPYILIWLASCAQDFGEVLVKVPKGELKSIEVSSDFIIGARYITLSYIRNLDTKWPVFFTKEGLELLGTKILPENMEFENGVFYAKDVALVANGIGETMYDAYFDLYENVLPEVYIPDGAYRTDLGIRVVNEAHFLYETGYISSWRYENMIKNFHEALK
ncbi:MAG: hypothetical protein QXF61_09245 [Nitrososphaeria archaeon]